ncbi:MAG: hypothetical protein EOP04_20845 [Proteobacteria bacterium]|nr:MAG: hypothetical protein EOP04_20845 [Pseudomonadota bacterium]
MGEIKDIPHPNWDRLKDDWLAHIPANLIPPSATAEELIRLSGNQLSDKKELDLVSGLRERTFGDVLFLRDKALYCFRISTSLNNCGHSTWTALSMYDACFFSTKSLVYLLGFRDCSTSSKMYCQLFSSTFKKNVKVFDGHYAISLKERLTHDSLWKIFIRLVNTIKGQSPIVAQLKSLKRNDYDSFTRDRNKLIYGSETWSRIDEIHYSDLFYDVSYIDNRAFINDSGITEAEYVDKYYRSAQTIINIVDGLLSDIGGFAPGVADHIAARPGLAPVSSVAFT